MKKLKQILCRHKKYALKQIGDNRSTRLYRICEKCNKVSLFGEVK